MDTRFKLLPEAFELLSDIADCPMGEWMRLYLTPDHLRAFNRVYKDGLITRQWDEAQQGYAYVVTPEGRTMLAVSASAPWNAGRAAFAESGRA